MKEEGAHASWRELLQRSVDLGLGALLLTKEAAEKAVEELVARGEISRQEGKDLVARMIERGKEQKERLEKLAAEAVERALEKTDLARASELRHLHALLAELRERVNRLELDLSRARPPHEAPQ